MPDRLPIMDLLIINAQVPGFSGLQQIDIHQGRIRAIAPMADAPPTGPVLDVAQDWISLGGIDLQINGALGLPFPELQAGDGERVTAICQYLWDQGVDGFLPTIVTTSVENVQRSLGCIAQHRAQAPTHATAQILGVHLEGPCLNPQKRGAHPAEYLLPLTLDQIKRVLGDYASLVKVITLAPELDETGTVIPYLRSLGMTISLGHSLATASQAQQAFAQGATMVTHAFNAMPPLHHRQPGLLGAAIVHPAVHCGLIADGQHVDPIMIEILLRASTPISDSPSAHDHSTDYPGVFLVSDALSPLGLSDGLYPWDNRQIEVIQGTARLPDGTLSGTTLPLLVGVQNLVRWGICPVGQAIALATLAPRRALGWLPTATATNPYINQPANLLRWALAGGRSGELTWQRLI